MVKDFAPDAAAMIGIGLALVVYGFYVGLFIVCVHNIRSKRLKNNLVNGSTMVLFILVTATTLLNYMNIYYSFVTQRETEGTLASLAVYANPLTEASGALFYLSALITESLLMWRLWVVWRGRLLVCTVPAIIYCCYILSGAGLVATIFLEAGPNREDYAKWREIFPPMAALVLLVQNLLVSTLISARLWRMGKTISKISANKDKGRFYSRIISAIVESAALYALTFMIFAIFRVLGMVNSSWVVLMLGPVMTGLTPTMIVWQLSLGTATSINHNQDSTFVGSAAGNGGPAYASRTGYHKGQSRSQSQAHLWADTPSRSRRSSVDLADSMGDVEMNWRTTLYDPELAQETSLRDASRRAAVNLAKSRTPVTDRWLAVTEDEEKGVGVLDADVKPLV